jgi:tetrahydromethanopterin S-methyltransferase subunit B
LNSAPKSKSSIYGGTVVDKKELDKLDSLAEAIQAIARAVTPTDAMPGRDASGGVVTSLTEAAMGISAGLNRVAESLESIAAAIREGHDQH